MCASVSVCAFVLFFSVFLLFCFVFFILCWASAAGHGACLEEWFGHPVRFPWWKLIFHLWGVISWRYLLGYSWGTCVHFPSQFRDPTWLKFVQALCMPPHCVFMCVFKTHCCLSVFHHLWFLQFSAPSSTGLPEPWKGCIWWWYPILEQMFQGLSLSSRCPIVDCMIFWTIISPSKIQIIILWSGPYWATMVWMMNSSVLVRWFIGKRHV